MEKERKEQTSPLYIITFLPGLSFASNKTMPRSKFEPLMLRIALPPQPTNLPDLLNLSNISRTPEPIAQNNYRQRCSLWLSCHPMIFERMKGKQKFLIGTKVRALFLLEKVGRMMVFPLCVFLGVFLFRLVFSLRLEIGPEIREDIGL